MFARPYYAAVVAVVIALVSAFHWRAYIASMIGFAFTFKDMLAQFPHIHVCYAYVVRKESVNRYGASSPEKEPGKDKEKERDKEKEKEKEKDWKSSRSATHMQNSSSFLSTRTVVISVRPSMDQTCRPTTPSIRVSFTIAYHILSLSHHHCARSISPKVTCCESSVCREQ